MVPMQAQPGATIFYNYARFQPVTNAINTYQHYVLTRGERVRNKSSQGKYSEEKKYTRTGRGVGESEDDEIVMPHLGDEYLSTAYYCYICY